MQKMLGTCEAAEKKPTLELKVCASQKSQKLISASIGNISNFERKHPGIPRVIRLPRKVKESPVLSSLRTRQRWRGALPAPMSGRNRSGWPGRSPGPRGDQKARAQASCLALGGLGQVALQTHP